MNRKKKVNYVLELLMWIVFGVTAYFIGSHRGYNNGMADMFYATIDTVQNIVNRQLKDNENIVTDLTLEGRDTVRYILTRKTMEDFINENKSNRK